MWLNMNKRSVNNNDRSRRRGRRSATPTAAASHGVYPRESFNEQCYQLLRRVPNGRVTTYKAMAEALGTRAYRAVGNAMNQNPYPKDLVPCHRVVNADGRLGGYVGGDHKKIALLQAEGVIIRNQRVVNFKQVLYTFDE